MRKPGKGMVFTIVGGLLAIGTMINGHLKSKSDAEAAEKKNIEHLDKLFADYTANRELNEQND